MKIISDITEINRNHSFQSYYDENMFNETWPRSDSERQKQDRNFVIITAETSQPNTSSILNNVFFYTGLGISENGDFLSPQDIDFLLGSNAKNYNEKEKALRYFQKVPELASYLKQIYRLEEKNEGRAASQLIFKFIESRFAASNLRDVNAFLETVNLNKLGPWSIAGLVRFTSRTRSHLPHWSATFQEAKKVLLNQGFNPEQLLIGIRG